MEPSPEKCRPAARRFGNLVQMKEPESASVVMRSMVEMFATGDVGSAASEAAGVDVPARMEPSVTRRQQTCSMSPETRWAPKPTRVPLGPEHRRE